MGDVLDSMTVTHPLAPLRVTLAVLLATMETLLSHARTK